MTIPTAKRTEVCPDCGADVMLKMEDVNGERMPQLYNLDGSRHKCEAEDGFEKHPIGQAVTGKKVTGFQLRGRRLTIMLDDGHVLSVSAAGKPLTLRLEGPTGILQE